MKVVEQSKGPDAISALCEAFCLGSKLSKDAFLEDLLGIFYQVGLVGVKPEPHLSRQWSHLDEPLLTKGIITEESMIDVHKTFWQPWASARDGAKGIGRHQGSNWSDNRRVRGTTARPRRDRAQGSAAYHDLSVLKGATRMSSERRLSLSGRR